MYVTLHGGDSDNILKVSNKELQKGAVGRVVFKTPLLTLAASVIP